MNTYIYEIGSFIFEVNSTIEIDCFPFNTFIENNCLSKIHISIHLDDSDFLKKEFLEKCQNLKSIIPSELEIFYTEINQLLHKKRNSKEHCNKYYTDGDHVFACFNYVTDNFCLKYSYTNNDIILYGNQYNLFRIILDFLSVSTTILPLHASALSRDNQGFCLIGNSKSGKTSILLKLLQRDFEFIADDSVFVNNDKIIRVSNSISIRTDVTPPVFQTLGVEVNKKVNFIVDKINCKVSDSATINKVIVLKKRSDEQYGLLDMHQPFPLISHHSFWCLHYLAKENKKEYITDLLSRSLSYWQEKIDNICHIDVDFSDFEAFIDNFCAYLNNLVSQNKIDKNV